MKNVLSYHFYRNHFQKKSLSALAIFKWISKSVYLMYLVPNCLYSDTSKIHLIQLRCIPMYSASIPKWLDIVCEYTEYTKYIIFQVQLKINFSLAHDFIKLSHVPCTRRIKCNSS